MYECVWVCECAFVCKKRFCTENGPQEGRVVEGCGKNSSGKTKEQFLKNREISKT